MVNKNKFLKVFNNLLNRIWVSWSNFRFKKFERNSTDVSESDKINPNSPNFMNDMKNLSRKLYDSFDYTKDGIDQLFDAVLPPSEAYKRYTKGLLKDDCDGFHSLVYHCVKNSNLKCYMLVVSSLKSGHCTLVLEHNGLWYISDYTTLIAGGLTLDAAVKVYNNYFPSHYDTSDVKYNAFVSYDYKKGKFKFLDANKTIKREDGVVKK